MPRYLIELSHGDEHVACVKALRAIEQSGSHFMTHADWGCKAGIEDRDEAVRLVPPEFRQEARIVELNRFTKEQIVSLLAELED
jgi:hypothetical protein